MAVHALIVTVYHGDGTEKHLVIGNSTNGACAPEDVCYKTNEANTITCFRVAPVRNHQEMKEMIEEATMNDGRVEDSFLTTINNSYIPHLLVGNFNDVRDGTWYANYFLYNRYNILGEEKPRAFKLTEKPEWFSLRQYKQRGSFSRTRLEAPFIQDNFYQWQQEMEELATAITEMDEEVNNE